MVPNILLTRFLSPSPVIFWAYVLPFIYWGYLVLTANSVVVFDSESYLSLANIFYHPSHWVEYFRTGPNREPLYPLTIAFSMHLGDWLNVPYAYILKILSFLFLAVTMFFIHQSLKKIKASPWLQAAAVFYTGFSPILINSALCVFSEIASLPFLVAAVFFAWLFVDSLCETNSGPLYPAWGLALSLLGFTFVKGLGEGLSPLFLLCLIGYSWRHYTGGTLLFLKRSKTKILLVFLVFYIPLLGFKFINYSQNNHFALTNRADLILYGNLVHRSHVPLNTPNFISHLLTVPVSHDLCGSFYPDRICSQWSMTATDETFTDRSVQLEQQNLDEAQRNKILVREISQALLSNPSAQIVYFLQEGLKMFFWETTQGPFVVYPEWLENLFNQHWIVLLMCFGVGLICIIAFLMAFSMLNNKLILMTLTLLSLLIFLYSFTNIVHRFTTTTAPLLILLVFACCDGAIKSLQKPDKSL